jgi:PKHD-type hydroxylase
MIGEWAYYKQHFTPEQCNSIIKQALELPPRPSKLGAGAGAERIDNEVRRSTLRSLVRNSTWNSLFIEIDKLVAQANREWFQLDYKFLPAIQFATYDSVNNGCYIRHQDTFLGPSPSHRKLSFTVQLSDPTTYEGGELKFWDVGQHPNPENMRAQGTVCVFPSIIFHEVTPVTSGVRHSLAGWYEGPQWR